MSFNIVSKFGIRNSDFARKGAIYKKIFFSLTFLFLILTPSTFGEDVFEDIDEYHEYYNSIKYLKDKGVIEGYDDGTFKPYQKVNRAEALKILLLGSKIKTDSDTILPFPDTNENEWYSSYIKKGLDLEIIEGYPDGTFKPAQTLNKVESIKMLLKTNEIVPAEVSLEKTALFNDAPIEEDTLWYQPYVFYAFNTNIVEPETIYSFEPQKEMTRGKMAEMMYRLSILQGENKSYFDTSQTGVASYYGDSFNGRRTSSGDIFFNDYFTAAHRSLPFDTFVKVMNQNSGISTFVKINDRGPYAEGRIIDLSKKSMATIERLSSGITNVKIVPIGVIPNTSKSYINKDTFLLDSEEKKVGVRLDNEIPTILFPNQIITLTGSTINEANIVTALITNQLTNKETIFQSTVSDKHFSIPIYIKDPGSYLLNIIPDSLGIGYGKISVIEEKYFDKGDFLKNSSLPNNLNISFQNSKTYLSWNKNGNSLFRIHFKQGEKERIFYTTNTNSINVPFKIFSDFKEGEVNVFIEGARTSTDFSIDRYTEWAKSETITFSATKHEYEIYKTDKVLLSSFSNFISGNSINLSGTAKEKISNTVWYTLPSGRVENIVIQNSEIDANSSFSFEMPVTEQGTYIVEMNDVYGEAVFNYPFYASGKIPLMPNLRDDFENLTSTKTLNLIYKRDKMLQSINTVRNQLSLSYLVLDESLNKLAQDRSDDMNARKYFSHVTLEGKNVNDIKTEYGITASLSENLAEDLNTTLALEGLLRSPVHRANLLSYSHSKVGIGITKTDDEHVIVTQVFE